MQNWAKRGLQTALVTGGMLMLGTGIASADENVNPDKPASPLDGSLTIPVDIGDNAIGTPLGQVDLPDHKATYSSKQVIEPVTNAIESVTGKAPALPTGDATAKVTEAVGGATSAATKATPAAKADEKAEEEAPADDMFRGNRGSLDLVVPVQIANNALALLGPAEVSGADHQQSYEGGSAITTDGNGQSLAGNVVDVDWAAPIQIANNAGGIGGDASSTGNNAEQKSKTGGHTTTDGADGVLAGNIVAPQGATPVQVNNNALGGGGTFTSSDNSASSEAKSGGALFTDGTGGVGAGNIAGVPVAFPVELNNGALAGLGKAGSTGNASSADATAGSTKPGWYKGRPTYTQTHGDDGVISGNIAQPQAAGDAAVHGIAGAVGGIANSGVGGSRAGAGNTNETSSKAGGNSNTDSRNGVLGGNIADAPVAAPVEAFCVAGSLVGKAASDCENTTSADAGGATYTDGRDSVLGSNSVNAPVGTTLEAFGIGAAGVGTADSTATEDKTVDAGGYNGTVGDGATGGGNLIQTPIAAPIETFGLGGSAVGSASGTASETKVVNAGGDGNTDDDDGTVASNLIATPIAQPVQVFGIGGAGVGHAHGDGTSDTQTNAGGDYKGSGKGGAISGNIVQGASSAPAQLFGIGGVVGGDASGNGDNTSTSTAGGSNKTDGSGGELSGNVVDAANSLPAQVHGLGGAVGGEGTATSSNVTDSAAGGGTHTDGSDSAGGGNVVSAPIAGAAGVFGSAAGVLGHAAGDSANDVVSTSGGDTDSNGDNGSLAGNAISADALPIAQAFGNGVSVLGFADGVGDSTTDAAAGGDVSSSGEGLSGNVLDVPAAAVAQVFGDALAVGGDASGIGDNTTVGSAGGVVSSDGAQAVQLPVGALAQVYNISGPVLGEALGVGANNTDITAGGAAPLIDLILNGAELPIDGLPSLPAGGLPAAGLPAQRSDKPLPTPVDVTPELMPRPLNVQDPVGALPGPAPELPVVPGATELPGLPELPELAELLPAAPSVPATPELPGLTEVPALPGLDGLGGVDGLPAVPALPEAPGVAMPLPAPALPEAPVTLPAPATAEVPQTLPAFDVMPQTAQIMPVGRSSKEAGFAGMWAKLVGMLTGKPMHIEG